MSASRTSGRRFSRRARMTLQNGKQAQVETEGRQSRVKARYSTLSPR
jgi:hypothetical protein